MSTIYEVSKLAKVSLATVSRVMNNSGPVAEKTRKKVLAAMAKLNYQPNSLAQSLASNRSNCVGVIVSELSGPIFGVMLSAIEKELRAAGHRRIAYLSGPLSWQDAKARFAGHKRALSDFGVKFDERLLYEGDYSEATGSRATHWVLRHVYGDEDLKIKNHFEPKLITRASVRQLGNDG